MMTDNFKNKRILFLSVKTFNYEKAIADKLKFLGAIVDYYDERPANSIFAKGIIRFKRSLYQKKINSYYKEMIKKTIGITYDSLFVIKGEVVPSFFLEDFKNRNPKCVFIYYTWDSFNNNPNAVSILKFFNRKFTFDSDDALMFNLDFRPLFFIDDYIINKKNNGVINYDLLFLGTAHSDRYKIGNSVVNWCDEQNLMSYAYYYMPSRFVYLFKMLFDSSFYSFEYKKLSFKSLNINEIMSLYNESAVILDINHPGQKGLTMRTFEALGAGKKIITTNKHIKKYPFYNENNVFVIDRENIVLHKTFFDSPFIEIESGLYEDMSISGWLKTIFVDINPNYWILKD
ncbi:MAG: hypothetical protein PHC28_13395 [Flavobacterium sp.]|uniref:hypothetical protein n=1 Tax=Flavobacterium sp. TaxID=239 RepID=UPI0026082543|nr:hypothetical protein [Flavobacterium sp.]MDD5151447.1 hypothetical protein [Flavobacterium sp.]